MSHLNPQSRFAEFIDDFGQPEPPTEHPAHRPTNVSDCHTPIHNNK